MCKSTHKTVFENSALFSQNLDLSEGGELSGTKCINIYKNLTRDIKMHFNAKYNSFLKENGFDPKDRMIQSAFYPIMIREFFKQTFDQELCQSFFG